MNEYEIIRILKIARRELDSLYPDVRIIDDWKYDDMNQKWYLHLSISIDMDNNYFPKTSQWYVVVDSIYPQGRIKIFPDVNNSIQTTLYHQANNYRINRNGLWRKGSLCVDVNTLTNCNPEPFSVEGRLLYHVKRAIDWLSAAANERLVSNKELFELPEFNDNALLDIQFAFSEDTFTYQQWEDAECNCGVVDIDYFKSNPTIYYAKTFYSFNNKPVHYTHWGSALDKQNSKKIRKVPWVLLKSVPILFDWQVPETWEELLRICQLQGFNLMDILKQSAKHLRDGYPHLFLLGFPIPKYWFADNEIIYWKAFQLPVLSYGTKTARGFRTKSIGYWQRDITEVFKPHLTIDWIISENWNQDEISQRGKIARTIQSKNILLLGAGCIGASIAEILVRSGVYNITIADSDIFEIGNLSRHILSLKSIGNSKCTSLYAYLNSLNPHAKVEYIDQKIKIVNDKGIQHFNIDIDKYDIIIDCTGENSILELFSNYIFKHTHYYASVSVGFGAKKLYINMQNGTTFNFDKFVELISPYIEAELQNIDEYTLPRDGIGCWHPTFPARSDDIWIAASISVKAIEKYVESQQTKQLSLVYEQKETDCYEGYFLIDRREGD